MLKKLALLLLVSFGGVAFAGSSVEKKASIGPAVSTNTATSIATSVSSNTVTILGKTGMKPCITDFDFTSQYDFTFSVRDTSATPQDLWTMYFPSGTYVSRSFDDDHALCTSANGSNLQIKISTGVSQIEYQGYFK